MGCETCEWSKNRLAYEQKRNNKYMMALFTIANSETMTLEQAVKLAKECQDYYGYDKVMKSN